MHEKATDAEDLRRLRRAENRILQQRNADTFALPFLIDGKTAQHGHRDRIGHVAPDLPRSLDCGNRPGGQDKEEGMPTT